MRKLKVIQVGLTHDHSSGMMEGLQRCLDMFDIVGYVDDRELITTACCNVRGFHLYENLPQLTLEEALNYPDLDAVFVEVTNGDLVRIAQMFADRKIPIHLDKPAGTDLAAYKKLLDTCEKYDLPFQMGYMFRGNMAMQLCLKAQREGWLGEIFEIQADMNHNYGSAVFEEYLASYPGGLMFNLACHFIDLFVKMLGEPDRVIPFLKTVPGWQPCNQNNCTAILEYPQALATFKATSHAIDGQKHRRLKIIGTKGAIELCPVEIFKEPWQMEMILAEGNDEYPAGKNIVKFPPVADRYEAHIRHFGEMVLGNIKNEYTYHHDYLVHRATLQACGLDV